MLSLKYGLINAFRLTLVLNLINLEKEYAALEYGLKNAFGLTLVLNLERKYAVPFTKLNKCI